MTRTALGAVFPLELSQARLSLHWAAQLVSAPGASLLPAQADDSHTNLGWDSELGVLVGRNVGAQHLRAALVFDGLELVVLDGKRERASLRLAGRTMSQALDETALTLPVYEMPAHPVGEGAPFSDAGAAARTELAVWFAEAFASIRKVVAADRSASPVRCWPHHFDVASLITLDAGADAEGARSIGVGLSPGDGSYDQRGAPPACRGRALAPRRMDRGGAHRRARDFDAGGRAGAHHPASTRPSRGRVP